MKAEDFHGVVARDYERFNAPLKRMRTWLSAVVLLLEDVEKTGTEEQRRLAAQLLGRKPEGRTR